MLARIVGVGAVALVASAAAAGTDVRARFSGLPGWLTPCDPATNPRYLCGEPPATEATPGNPKQYSIIVTATAPHGASAGKAFSLTVEDAA